MLKGLPLTYDRDMQEDKEPVFDAVDTLLLVLPALAGMIATMRFDGPTDGRRRADRLTRSPPRSPSGWSVRACRSARRTRSPARCVALCDGAESQLGEVSDDDLAAVSPHLTPDVRSVLTVEGALAARAAPGGDRPRPGSPSSSPQLRKDARRASGRGPAVRPVLARASFDRPGARGRAGPARLRWSSVADVGPTAMVAVRLTEVEAYAG